MNKAQKFLLDNGQSDLLLKDSKDFSKRLYLSDLLQQFSLTWPPNQEVAGLCSCGSTEFNDFFGCQVCVECGVPKNEQD